jgi:hypothetical protein
MSGKTHQTAHLLLDHHIPQMESLEPRLLLSGDVTVTTIAGGWMVKGDGLSNEIVIDQTGQPAGWFQITSGPSPTTINGLPGPVRSRCRRSQQRSGRNTRRRIADCKRRQIRWNRFTSGYPPASETHTPRTDTRTDAPIFNSFRRIVSHRAWSIFVPDNPSRRNPATSTYPSDVATAEEIVPGAPCCELYQLARCVTARWIEAT